MNVNRDSKSKHLLEILGAIKDALDELDAFEQCEAPPEPSTAKARAQWAVSRIKAMMDARLSLIGLARAVPQQLGMKTQAVSARDHVLALAHNRQLDYVKQWAEERGIAWREMRRPLKDREGLSWADLLGLDDWDQ